MQETTARHSALLLIGLFVLGSFLTNPETLAFAEELSSQTKDGLSGKTSRTSPQTPLDSGRKVGDYVPTFYTRAVTGPLMNRSVCYVCRNGQRPVVMVLLQKLGPDVKPLLKQMDTLVDDHRAQGLRSFGVYVSNDPTKAISAVQTFSFDHKISIPLTVASPAVAEPSCQNLDPEADVTLVLYQNRRVVKRFAFRQEDIKTSQLQSVKKSVHQLLIP